MGDGSPTNRRSSSRSTSRRATTCCSPTTKIPTFDGGLPSSSPPKRWNGVAGTGGPPTASGDRVPRRRSSGAGAAHRVADRSRRRPRRAVSAGGYRERDRDPPRAGHRRLPGRRGGTATRSSTSSPFRGPRKVRRWRSCSRAINGTCRCWRSTLTPVRPRSSGGPRRPMDAHHPGVPAWLPGDRLPRRATATTRACC